MPWGVLQHLGIQTLEGCLAYFYISDPKFVLMVLLCFVWLTVVY